MNTYERQKLVEVVLYILNKTSGLDYYHLFKVMYFAEREHLASWGDRITADEFHALPHGPAPTLLYDTIKKKERSDDFSRLLWGAVEFAGGDAPYVLLPKRAPDMRYISASEEGALDKSTEENAKRLFGELKAMSHDEAWKSASKRKPKVILHLDMAKAADATDATVAYIQEQQAIDRALA
ncbi:MAG: SocA family protein [Prevotellaceae bacterium]|jgi:hypothetical protein|nr:SocA family protein [Prevotellaceae bacterium]